MLSIIIPSYNEEANISRTTSCILEVMNKNKIPWGTLRKEGAPGRLLYLSLISSWKRCKPLWLRRFLFAALGEVLMEGFFHLLRGQLVEDAHAAVIDVQKLHPLAVKVSGCIHHDFVHKLVD